MFDESSHGTDIYQLVFSLSKLKYYKFVPNKTNLFVSLPTLANEQSPLEYLLIDHYCTFQELAGIAYCTPQLRYLKFSYDFNSIENKSWIPSIRLETLIYLSLHMDTVDFVNSKRFIRTINCKLKKLSIITQSEDITYLHASRWEQLIRDYFPQLNKFDLTYYNKINNDNHQ
ncbi:unnamed protein product [Rotaria sp. Silwood1]|nr:unnamed protein product [Rotaria sp. Silwood1]CAF1471395.1 unnamed protein product [Rotaria sp. Silwood1]CAF3730354.1 unnamed protein product [Rotaria sp. Silwood1]CAF4855634.1 unnamed protein product [Rotaria sp. Silwood1]